MKLITGEWIAKAEGDFALQDANIVFPKTHDLADLLTSAIVLEPTWTSMMADLNTLSAFAVEYRYPGDSADLVEAKEAFQICHNVRQVMRARFSL